jgi:predicted phage terminase large subunit-like protein
MNSWTVVYERAIRSDGSLLFPERLTADFLDQARRTMGSYVFANQYQNEIIPEGEQSFKKHWLRYYRELPEECFRFAFIDPAISEADTADYTALAIVSADADKNWYVELVERYRMNPSQMIELCFQIAEKYQPQVIGIEDVAFQRAIMHFAVEEMRRRDKWIPVTGVKRSPDKSKQMRILGLVPRFEWGSCLLSQSCGALEDELSTFPRGAHDDCLDALASIEDIIYYPEKRAHEQAPNPNDSGYESWYIQQRLSGKAIRGTDPELRETPT